MTAIEAAEETGTGKYASVNGLRLYFEVHGAGEPLVVIPGGFMTIAMMAPVISALAPSRQVIALEPQAHGHTADIDRPLTYEQMADDTAALMRHLGLDRADIFGFSAGAGVALQTAIRHPDRVRALIVCSGAFRGDAEVPEMRSLAAAFAPEMPILAPLRQAYLAANPNPDGWAALVSKMRDLVAEQYDWSAEVSAIRAPTLVVVGDADSPPVAHAVEMFQLLGGDTGAAAMGRLSKARLAVLPGTWHFDIIGRPELGSIVARFLASPPENG